MPKTCECCPNKDSELGCPCWITPEYGFTETNITTGEVRIVTGCFYQVIPKLLMHVVAASNRPAAAFEELRNNIALGFRALGTRQLVDHMEKIVSDQQGLISNGK